MSSTADETSRDATKGRSAGASRSPNYPQMNITQAIERIRKVYSAEHTHSVPDQSIAAALGYTSLNGTSKVVLSSLKKFGLLIPSGDGFKVSQDAIAILELPVDDPTRIVAMHRSALRPPVFKQLYEKYGNDLPSDASLRHYLVGVGFESDAANQVIRHFKDTLNFMTAQSAEHEERSEVGHEEQPTKRTAETNRPGLSHNTVASASSSRPNSSSGTSQFRFQVAVGCSAEVSFTSQITREAIAKLIQYLNLSMDLYPTTALVQAKSTDHSTFAQGKSGGDDDYIDAEVI